MSAASASPQPAVNPAANSNSEDAPKNMEKTLQKENKRLRGDIKQMEIKVKSMQGELKKSNQVKDRLEALCRELQKQNRYIKAESSAKITEANEKGKELAQEVQSNMGFIKNINENLASITSETMQVRKENEELAKKIGTLKAHYEEREQVMKSVIDETSSALQEAKLELGELRLKNAQEKEKLLGEMQQLSTALIQSREQMKEAKETEINLRLLLQNYDDKFNGLQKALKETNGAYEEFKSEMSRVTGRTRDLEKETLKWQNRWEESSTALKLMKENHAKLQGELTNAEQSLERMKGLCRAMQNERKELLEELKQKSDDKSRAIHNQLAELGHKCEKTLLTSSLEGPPLNLISTEAESANLNQPSTVQSPSTDTTSPPVVTENKEIETKIAENKPVETKPEETKLTETKPEETKPTETKPEETKLTETKPEETKPTETKPEETKPTETKPEETKLTETKPEERKPEAKPRETKSVVKPTETKSVAKPTETKPVAKPEAKPTEPTPVETKPTETKSAETKPTKAGKKDKKKGHK